MKKNDLFELEITDMGVDGEGIGHFEGMTFFVKDALIGDVIKARAMKLKKNYGYARVEEVITPSAFRVEPKCPHHRRCGGCQIQALSYEKQLEFKQQKVRGNLIRIGGFAESEIDAQMLPAVGMEVPYRYRNKAQFPVGTDKEGNLITGFYAARTHSIIPVEDCLLGVEVNAPILTAVKEWMTANGVSAYDETTGKGLLRHVLIRFGFTTKEIMVCLIINGRTIPAQNDLTARLSVIEGMTSISININTKNTNVILGDVTECIWGQAYITDYIHLRTTGNMAGKQETEYDFAGAPVKDSATGECNFAGAPVKDSATGECNFAGAPVKDSATGECNFAGAPVKDSESGEGALQEFSLTDTAVAYRISPQSFYQVNPVQTEKLYSTALDYAGLTGKEYVWDLYCGIGTISLFLAQKAKQVYGVEIVPQAIEDAKNNAKLNGITNAEFFVGKAEEVLPEFYEKLEREAKCKSVQDAVVYSEYMNLQNTVECANIDENSLNTAKMSRIQSNAEKVSGNPSDVTELKQSKSKQMISEEPKSMLHPDVIVVDPPRKGCDQACLDTMLKMEPKRIVYVSCDSATLARDLRILCDGGYELQKVRVFDQFGHTTHTECCVLLTR